jgi:NIMA (never in mitosis gene a)-related kinase 1/4/5
MTISFRRYNHKSDIWALGCVLYEMSTLNHAFDAQSLNGLATKIIKGRYPPVDSKYSTHLRELIASMLSTSPAARPDLDQILTRPFIKRHIKDFFKVPPLSLVSPPP